MLIDRGLISVFGESTGDEPPVLARRAKEELATREGQVAANEERMREWDDRLYFWEDELDVREQHNEPLSKAASRPSTTRVKVGRNERCHAGQISRASATTEARRSNRMVGRNEWNDGWRHRLDCRTHLS